MTIYLYVKTHNKTGLKYLGKTQKDDPHKYSGSGKYWLRHLNEHGYNYSTAILLSTNDEKELKETGLFFSKLFNVVKSNEWANLIVENGDGIDSDTARKIAVERVENKTHPFLKENRSPNMDKNFSDTKGKTYEEIYGLDLAEKLKENRSDSNKSRWDDENFRKKVSEKISKTRKEKFSKGELSVYNKGKTNTNPEFKMKVERLRNDFISSGLSRKEYAEKHKINYNTLKKYLKGL